MTNLAAQPCEACRAGAPTVTEEEIRELMPDLPEWEIVTVAGVARLTRTFRFPDFATALEFSNRIGEIAEESHHHPELVTGWGSVKVSWWTHKIRGLHRNDFIMAARTDGLASD